MIEAIAQEAGISKSAAQKALDATTNAVTNALKNGDTVTLVGFGTFYVGERAERLKLFRRPLVYRVYIKAETQTITRAKVSAFLISLPTFDFYINKIYH